MQRHKQQHDKVDGQHDRAKHGTRVASKSENALAKHGDELRAVILVGWQKKKQTKALKNQGAF